MAVNCSVTSLGITEVSLISVVSAVWPRSVPLAPGRRVATFEGQTAFSLVEASFVPFGVMFVVILIIMPVVLFAEGRDAPLGQAAAAGYQSFLGADGTVVAAANSDFESASFVGNCCYSWQLVNRSSHNIDFDNTVGILNYPILFCIGFSFGNLVFEIQHSVGCH